MRTVTAQPDGSYSERGLLGLAISPTFTTDRFVYAFYSDASYRTQHVIRWYDCDGTGTHPTIIATFPAGSDCCHKGGRIAFGPDGKLYVTLGDEHDAPERAERQRRSRQGAPLQPQRHASRRTIHSDRPTPSGRMAFATRSGSRSRPPGQLAITMNGPSGDAGSPGTGYDTLYLNVTRGAHYQWPDCYGYSHPLAASTCGGGVAPSWSSEASTYVPDRGDLRRCERTGWIRGPPRLLHVRQGHGVVTAGSPHATVRLGPSGCRFDVAEGPNHALYYSDQTHIYELA